MIIELLMIGNEILIGKTQDTNSNWMAKRITKFGHIIRRITTIGDSLEEISNTIRAILNRKPNMIIISGGLGPTFDDMTLQGMSLGLNRELELNQHAYDSIKKAYNQGYKRGIMKIDGMTKEREKMAYLPKGSIPLPNLRGTAPGVKMEENNVLIFCLPGVPMEMKSMFKIVILPILQKEKGSFIQKGIFISGIGESEFAPYVTQVEQKYPNIWIKSHPRLGEYGAEIEISITAFNIENGDEISERALEEIKNFALKLDCTIKTKNDMEKD